MNKDHKPKRGVLLGDWGHFSEVVNEMEGSCGALSLVGKCGGDLAEAEALLREARPDFAIVSARPDCIAPLIALSARHGCHVVSEKPLALDIGSLAELRGVVEAAGVRVCDMLPNRARPPLAAAVAAIRSGAIGKPLLLSARKTYKWGRREPWFGDRAAYGGTIPWIGIHALDFIDSATGGDPVAEVSAFHANLAHPGFPGCEDVCVLSMRLASGALASATLDYLRPDSPVPHGDDYLRVIGDKGEVEVWIDRGRAVLLESGAAPRDLPLPPPAPFYAPWLLALPPRGVHEALDDRTLRAFRLTAEALAGREATDTGRAQNLSNSRLDAQKETQP